MWAFLLPAPANLQPMTDDELIQKLAATVAAQLLPPIPVSIDLNRPGFRGGRLV